MDVYYSIPPITRALITATVVISVAVHAGIVPFYHVVFLVKETFWGFPPQIWRPFTSFFVSKGGLSLIFDPYFLYMCANTLETNSPRFPRKADFVWYLVFNMIVILVLSKSLVGGYTFLAPLILALAYTYGQDNPQRRVNISFFPIQAKFLAYAMLGLSFVMGGSSAMFVELPGLISAHLYDFLTRIWPTFGGGRNMIPTPVFLQQLFAEQRSGPTTRGYGTAYAARRPDTTPTSGWTSGWMGSAGSRGTGRRLGD